MDRQNPHDAFFRSWFSRPRHLEALLRMALDPSVTAKLDLTTLQVRDSTFIDGEHLEHFSDLTAPHSD